MRYALWLAAALIASAVTAAVATYPRVGGLVYELTLRTEAALYGLHKAAVDGGDSRMMTYQGGPADAREAVVMIHGYSADKAVWLRFAKHFTSTYRVVIIDLAGHGETPFVPALRYDSTSQAERVLRAMDDLGIDQAHLIGNSMGGFIAARMAHDHPERVISATLMDAAGVSATEPSAMDRLLLQGINPFLIEDRAGFDRFYAMTMAKAPWVPRITRDFIADKYIANRAQLAQIFKDFHRVGMLDSQLANIRTPTLVMWGAKDQLVSPSAAAVWCAEIPDCQRISYDDLGHMPMVEDPARSAADVRAFLSAHTAQTF